MGRMAARGRYYPSIGQFNKYSPISLAIGTLAKTLGNLASSSSGTVNYSGGSATPFRIVRTNQSYATLDQAVNALHNDYFLNGARTDDVIKMTGGTYICTTESSPGNVRTQIGYASNYRVTSLTIEPENPAVPMISDVSVLSAYDSSHGGSGHGVVLRELGVYLKVSGLHINGAPNIDGTTSGFYIVPGPYPLPPDGQGYVSTFIAENCKVTNFEQGLSTNWNENLSVYLRNCVFQDNHGSAGRHHGIYVSVIKRLEVDGCTFNNTHTYSSSSGHLLKTRAKTGLIRGSYFSTKYGADRCIDICNGGDYTITGNIILHYGGVWQSDNQMISWCPEQQSSFWGTGEWADDNRTHSLYLAQNTIRKVSQAYQSDAAQSYQVIGEWTPVDINNQPMTTTKTIRNNIVGANTYAGVNSASVFVGLYPSNTAVSDTTISDLGVYSGGVVAGNPAVNDAVYAWAGELLAPLSRSDTNRGGIRTQTSLLTAAQSLSSGQWLRFRQSGQITTSLPSGDASLLRPYNANILGYFDKAKYDPTRMQLLWIGKDANGQGNHERLVVYNEQTDSITSTDTATLGFPAHTGHGYCNNTINPATGEYYYRLYDAGNPIMYRNTSGAWSQLTGPVMQFGGTGASATEWFPEGNVLTVSGRGMMYTLTGSTWTQRATGLDTGYNHTIAQYSKARGKVYFGGGNTDASGQGLYRLNADLTIDHMTNCTVPWGCGGDSVTVIEPVTGDLLVCTGTTWYRFYDDGSNSGAGRWVTYAIGTGGDGKPVLPIGGYGTATYSLPAPYNCMVFMRDNGGTSWDMWLYKD